MWILNIIKRFVKFFGSKIVKKATMSAGVGAGIGACIEMVVARKRNNRAERIKADAIEKHNEGRKKVESTLAALGETKLAVYESFGELADAIESIQQRPDYELSIEGIELPNFKPAEFKQLAMEIEAVVGGVGSVAVGSAIGVAVKGTGSLLALAPGALLSGVVLCAMGAKMLYRSAENVKAAKKIESDVESILKFYNELDETAKQFHESFLKVQEPYFKHIRKLQGIVARKTDWEKFSKAERLSVKNTIVLAQLLHRMCSIQLVLDASEVDTLEKVNTLAINQMITDADNVFEQVEKDIVA